MSDLYGVSLDEYIYPHLFTTPVPDTAGRWRIFHTRRKMDTIKSVLVYGLFLAVVVAGVILAMTV